MFRVCTAAGIEQSNLTKQEANRLADELINSGIQAWVESEK